MKTAILSDIHGNDVAFEAIQKDMISRSINNVIFLGDLVATGPQPLEVYQRLQSMNPLVRIKGNTDAWLDDAMIDVIPSSEKEIMLLNYYDYMTHHLNGKIMDDIISFDYKKTLQLGHFQVLCLHGSPKGHSDPMSYKDPLLLDEQLKGVASSVVLSGHTHRAHDFTHRIYRLINPGSIGLCNSDNDTRAYYTMIDTTGGFHVEQLKVDYEVEKVLQIAKERNFPNLDDYTTRLTHHN